ncbi:MAG: PadR family transcriptional regulator [Actinomycetota bacterium]|nr:PadR family transcriptional regulator [Actinomycetota bacterium]
MSVKHGLLAMLNRRSMHGYELGRELEDELGPSWAVNYGQVYTTLERLARDGFVVQSETVSTAEAPDRKLYTVTPAGRAELRRWFLAPIEGVGVGRDELYAKILLGLTAEIDIDDVIHVERKAQLRRIGQLTEAKERLNPDLDLAAVLQLDMSIMKTDAVIQWLDSAESKIRAAVASQASGLKNDATRALTPRRDAATPSDAKERGRR